MSWASAWDTLKYDPLGGLTTAVSSISDKVSSTETGAWLLEGASSVGTMASDVAGTVALSLEETADADQALCLLLKRDKRNTGKYVKWLGS